MDDRVRKEGERARSEFRLKTHPWWQSGIGATTDSLSFNTPQLHAQLKAEIEAFRQLVTPNEPLTVSTIMDYVLYRHNMPRRLASAPLSWTTSRRQLGAIVGMLQEEKSDLIQSSQLKQALRATQKRAFLAVIKVPTPVTVQHWKWAVADLDNNMMSEAARYLEMWYSTASRPLDADVRVVDVDMAIDEPKLAVTFTNAKATVIRGGPYTVTTTLSNKMRQFIKNRRAQRQPMLFSNPSLLRDQALKALRNYDIRYEARSMRRGALQELSANGASTETLLAFSGHKNVLMLQRYLLWGKLNVTQQKETYGAAQATFE